MDAVVVDNNNNIRRRSRINDPKFTSAKWKNGKRRENAKSKKRRTEKSSKNQRNSNFSFKCNDNPPQNEWWCIQQTVRKQIRQKIKDALINGPRFFSEIEMVIKMREIPPARPRQMELRNEINLNKSWRTKPHLTCKYHNKAGTSQHSIFICPNDLRRGMSFGGTMLIKYFAWCVCISTQCIGGDGCTK